MSNLRFMKPSAKRKPSKGKKRGKAASGTTQIHGVLIDGVLIDGVAMFDGPIQRWVIRLDDGSGLSELGFTSLLRRYNGRRVRLEVLP